MKPILINSSFNKACILAGMACLLFLFFSCRDDFESNAPGLELEFSADTVLFDTVFTNIGTITKQFKAKNPHSTDLKISRIELGKGDNSHYRINVDGRGGHSFEDVRLGAGDSMYIFVDANIDASDESLPFIERDSVRFLGEDGLDQHVKLMAWGQNANFYHNELVCDETWTKDKPYVIFDSILVPQGCYLEIEAGTRVHSHFNSSILIGGTMIADGTTESPITFAGDRLDEFYKDQSGQWIGIRFLPGSQDNIMNNTIVKNGIRGVQVDSLPVNNNPNLILQNTHIKNMDQLGLLGNTSHIRAINCVISDCGQHLFAGVLGGEYELIHCTFANTGHSFSHEDPSVIFDNADFSPESGSAIINDLEVTMINSILWGRLDNELGIFDAGNGEMQLSFASNLLKTEIEDLDEQNILNEDPIFKDPGDMNYRLEDDSPAIGQGEILDIDTDIEGNTRKEPPDMGAYETSP